jgi:hypothetical protein
MECHRAIKASWPYIAANSKITHVATTQLRDKACLIEEMLVVNVNLLVMVFYCIRETRGLMAKPVTRSVHFRADAGRAPGHGFSTHEDRSGYFLIGAPAAGR